MKVYYNLNKKEFYTDEPYYGERVYISGKESTNDIVTMIAFGRSWFANVFDSSDVHLPCTLLELFCDYSEQVGELIIYDIDERRLSSSEFTVKYDAESHSFIPISGGFSFVNERVNLSTCILSLTVILIESDNSPDLAVIVTSPTLIAETFPSKSTVAIVSSLDI